MPPGPRLNIEVQWCVGAGRCSSAQVWAEGGGHSQGGRAWLLGHDQGAQVGVRKTLEHPGWMKSQQAVSGEFCSGRKSALKESLTSLSRRQAFGPGRLVGRQCLEEREQWGPGSATGLVWPQRQRRPHSCLCAEHGWGLANREKHQKALIDDQVLLEGSEVEKMDEGGCRSRRVEKLGWKELDVKTFGQRVQS